MLSSSEKQHNIHSDKLAMSHKRAVSQAQFIIRALS
jgi:hypothetical protein